MTKFLAPASVIFQVYKLTTLASLAKSPNEIPLFIVSRNFLGKPFAYKFLGTFSTNGSLKNILCYKSILIIVQEFLNWKL